MGRTLASLARLFYLAAIRPDKSRGAVRVGFPEAPGRTLAWGSYPVEGDTTGEGRQGGRVNARLDGSAAKFLVRVRASPYILT
jgi:hypothetical protein